MELESLSDLGSAGKAQALMSVGFPPRLRRVSVRMRIVCAGTLDVFECNTEESFQGPLGCLSRSSALDYECVCHFSIAAIDQTRRSVVTI